ncbi:hypothetical protein CPB83DRAFT_900722 [Crepidotus variabilis]|uniref:Uncharacterized protein n=1 Tax=Crepidotus variabilis TaxID=179855 RepID=A0A9P6BE18_9AGAR|nr:hypothetical protein CPB83DRAFT_900722 [Crepidotus variabilis]
MNNFELGSIPLFVPAHENVKLEEMEVEDLLSDVADEDEEEILEDIQVCEFEVFDTPETMDRRFPHGLPSDRTQRGNDIGATENPLAVSLPEDLLAELQDVLPICCVCEHPIVPTDEEFGNVLFKLSLCGHKLHLGCNCHLAQPFDIQGCFAPRASPSPEPALIIEQGGKEVNIYYTSISELEDADYVNPWVCPEEGCDTVYYSFLKDGVWNNRVTTRSRGSVMTYKGKAIGGVRTAYIVKPAIYRFEAPSFKGTTLV